MIRITTAIALLVSAACLAQNPDLPEELAGLVPLLDDQARLFETVRALDKRETALAQEEFARAKGLAGQDGEGERAEALRTQAEKRLSLVRLAYEELLERHPGSAQGHNFYGELLYDHFSDEAAALKEWRLAEALDRKYSAPLNNLAIHYCHNAEPLRGLDYFERVLELDPDQPDYLFNVVQVYLTQFPEVQARYGWDSPRLYAEAMKLSKRAVEKDPDDYDLWKDYAQNPFSGRAVQREARLGQSRQGMATGTKTRGRPGTGLLHLVERSPRVAAQTRAQAGRTLSRRSPGDSPRQRRGQEPARQDPGGTRAVTGAIHDVRSWYGAR